MTIAIERRHFNQAVKLAGLAIDQRSAIPILSTLKATANGSFALEGADLDMFTRIEVPYIGDHGTFCLPAPARIAAMVGAAGSELVTFQPKEDNKLGLVSGALTAELNSYAADDFPGMDSIAEERFGADLGGGELAQLVRIMPAISTEETRYYLNGICVWHLGDWTYRFAATDGHRLMLVDIPMPGANGELTGMPILPKRFLTRALAAFAASKDAVRLSWGPKVARNERGEQLELPETGNRLSLAGVLRDARLTITTKLIDGTFPDVMRVVPTEIKHSAVVARRELAQAVNALTPMGSKGIRAVKLTFLASKLSVSLVSAEMGSARFSIACDHAAPDGFEIGFNGRYLLDALGALRGDEAVLGLGDSGSPTLISDPADTAFRCVLMPMRV